MNCNEVSVEHTCLNHHKHGALALTPFLGAIFILLSSIVFADESLTSFSAGALIVSASSEYDQNQWSAAGIADESPKVGWASATGKTTEQTIVIELAGKSILSHLEFDTAKANQADGAAKNITVSVSDVGPQDGFQTIAVVALKDRKDRQRFVVQNEISGKWVKLTLHDNYGNNQWAYLMDFRGYGRQLEQALLTNVSGMYTSTYGAMHILHDGTTLTGCYGSSGQTFDGGVDGNVMRLTWHHKDGRFGPAMMVFSSDGAEFFGYWWEGKSDADPAHGTRWAGRKSSDKVGSCPGWRANYSTELEEQLEHDRRSRLYGIQFDLDSDAIRPQSMSTLEKVVSVLASNSTWRLMIEGHTDADGTSSHNIALSKRRAEAVRNYLLGKGIEKNRLETNGFGESQPLVPNDTALGRSQNRRVELVRL
jgi:outer membrane protein OmpA-like peptidoglycan-associated protein